MQPMQTSADSFAKISFDLSLILDLRIQQKSVAGLGETNTSHYGVYDLDEWGQELDIKCGGSVYLASVSGIFLY